MESYIQKVEIRWSDLDPNFHVLHSKYYDFGAFCRMAFFVESGLTPDVMQQHHIGPVLFREECIFKREIAFGDDIEINLRLVKRTADYGRWSMDHEIWKNKNVLAAVMNIDAAWLDTIKRKLTVPAPELTALFDTAPKAQHFHII